METNVKIVGFANESFNGKTVSSKGFDVNYDGNIADINAFSDGKVYYTRLDNQDIQNLLNIPTSSSPLEERLALEYNQKNIPGVLNCKIVRNKSKRRRSHRHTKHGKKSKRKSVVKIKSRVRSNPRARRTVRRIRERTPTPYFNDVPIDYNPSSIERTIY